MTKNSISLPARTHVALMQHKYSINDKVRNVNKEHKMYGEYGIIKSLVPYSFKHPAYDVVFGDKIVAMSEKSLEKEELT
jgi:hypothetical protein